MGGTGTRLHSNLRPPASLLVPAYNDSVRTALLLLAAAALLAQSPFKVEYACTPDDADSFGLSCSPEDPCAVFVELSSAEFVGSRIFVTGNIHTERTTLYGILLASEDGGHSWSEPLPRIRAASIEQIQFFDFSSGWISGQIIEPLPKEPFFLITTDGGKSWRRKPVYDDSRFGSVAQFWFDSKTHGELVIDHGSQHELLETNTGGENWDPRQLTTQAIHLKTPPAAAWRLRATPDVYHLERRGSPAWEPVASFTIHIADCK
jgi:hypothetical protein